MMHELGKRKSDKSRRVNPLCLILSPTRELAQQDIVIATPGRLKDLIEMGKCNLQEASFVKLTSQFCVRCNRSKGPHNRDQEETCRSF